MLLHGITYFWCLLFFIENQLVLGQESSEVTDRIVNGKDVKIGERPYQVQFRYYTIHFCGGTIISDRYVLTAAHCLRGIEILHDLIIVTGTVNLYEPYEGYRASKMIPHKGYLRENSSVNDIALLQTAKPIKFSYRVQPIALPKPHLELKPGTPVIVSGWGKDRRGRTAIILQEVMLQILDPEKCLKSVATYNLSIFNTQLCADDNDDTKLSGSCTGDSGGPLTTTSGVFVGIVSWSIKVNGCGNNEYPDVFTKVSAYIDWIKENMK